MPLIHTLHQQTSTMNSDFNELISSYVDQLQPPTSENSQIIEELQAEIVILKEQLKKALETLKSQSDYISILQRKKALASSGTNYISTTCTPQTTYENEWPSSETALKLIVTSQFKDLKSTQSDNGRDNELHTEFYTNNVADGINKDIGDIQAEQARCGACAEGVHCSLHVMSILDKTWEYLKIWQETDIMLPFNKRKASAFLFHKIAQRFNNKKVSITKVLKEKSTVTPVRRRKVIPAATAILESPENAQNHNNNIAGRNESGNYSNI